MRVRVPWRELYWWSSRGFSARPRCVRWIMFWWHRHGINNSRSQVTCRYDNLGLAWYVCVCLGRYIASKVYVVKSHGWDMENEWVYLTVYFCSLSFHVRCCFFGGWLSLQSKIAMVEFAPLQSTACVPQVLLVGLCLGRVCCGLNHLRSGVESQNFGAKFNSSTSQTAVVHGFISMSGVSSF